MKTLKLFLFSAFLGAIAVVGCKKTDADATAVADSSISSSDDFEEKTIEEYEYEPNDENDYDKEAYINITDITGEKYGTQDDCPNSRFKDYYLINNANTIASPVKYITIKLPQKDVIFNSSVAPATASANVQFDFLNETNNPNAYTLTNSSEDSLTYTFALELKNIKSGNTLWGKNCTYGAVKIYAFGRSGKKYSIKLKVIEKNLYAGIPTTNRHGLLVNKYTYPTNDSNTDTITMQKLKSEKTKTKINLSSDGTCDYVPQKWDIICFGETDNKRGFIASDIITTPPIGTKKRKYEFDYCITNATCTNGLKIKRVKVYENKLTLLKCNSTDNLTYFIR